MAPRVERPNMADYGVPNELEGAMPWEWARERLVACRNFWVATVDPAGRPHSMPVWGVWADDPDGFFFSCAPSALKARNLDSNPHVVVAIDNTVECVSVEGVATSLGEGPATERHVAAFVAKYELDPFKAEQMAEFLRTNRAFFVSPTKAFGIIETEADFGPKATRWAWPSSA